MHDSNVKVEQPAFKFSSRATKPAIRAYSDSSFAERIVPPREIGLVVGVWEPGACGASMGTSEPKMRNRAVAISMDEWGSDILANSRSRFHLDATRFRPIRLACIPPAKSGHPQLRSEFPITPFSGSKVLISQL